MDEKNESQNAGGKGQGLSLRVLSPSLPPIQFSDISAATTILALKELISKTAPSHPSELQQRLIFRGRPLRDNQSLEDIFGAELIRENDTLTIHLVVPNQTAGTAPQVLSPSSQSSPHGIPANHTGLGPASQGSPHNTPFSQPPSSQPAAGPQTAIPTTNNQNGSQPQPQLRTIQQAPPQVQQGLLQFQLMQQQMMAQLAAMNAQSRPSANGQAMTPAQPGQQDPTPAPASSNAESAPPDPRATTTASSGNPSQTPQPPQMNAAQGQEGITAQNQNEVNTQANDAQRALQQAQQQAQILAQQQQMQMQMQAQLQAQQQAQPPTPLGFPPPAGQQHPVAHSTNPPNAFVQIHHFMGPAMQTNVDPNGAPNTDIGHTPSQNDGIRYSAQHQYPGIHQNGNQNGFQPNNAGSQQFSSAQRQPIQNIHQSQGLPSQGGNIPLREMPFNQPNVRAFMPPILPFPWPTQNMTFSSPNLPTNPSASYATSDGTSTVYLLSSSSGPKALLVGPSGTYQAPWLQHGLSSIPNALNIQRHATMPVNQVSPPFASAPNMQLTHTVSQRNFPVPEQAVPAERPADNRPANDAQQPNVRAQELAGVIIPLGAHIWLLIRLLGFVWFFSYGASATRTTLLLVLATIVFFAQTGIFQPIVEQARRHLRQYADHLNPLGHQPLQPGNAPAREPTGNRGENASLTQRPNANLSPEDTARRLLQQRREENNLRQILRRIERALTLFIASLVPGVGERHVAAQEEMVRVQREQIERQEQEARDAQRSLPEGEAASSTSDQAAVRLPGEENTHQPAVET